MKKTGMKTLMIVAMALCMMIFSCATDSGEDNGGGKEKITSLQAAINNAKSGDTINLSEYPNIKDFDATISKQVTILGNPTDKKDMNGKTLTVSANNVSISGISNATVTASKDLGEGNLKISSSSLNDLYVFGGGANSIHIVGSKVKKVAASKENVRIKLEGETELKQFLANKDCKIEGDDKMAKVTQLMLGDEAGSVTLAGQFNVDTLFVQNADTSTVTLNSSKITIAKAGAAAGEIKIECSEGVTAPEYDKIDAEQMSSLKTELQNLANDLENAAENGGSGSGGGSTSGGSTSGGTVTYSAAGVPSDWFGKWQIIEMQGTPVPDYDGGYVFYFEIKDDDSVWYAQTQNGTIQGGGSELQMVIKNWTSTQITLAAYTGGMDEIDLTKTAPEDAWIVLYWTLSGDVLDWKYPTSNGEGEPFYKLKKM